MFSRSQYCQGKSQNSCSLNWHSFVKFQRGDNTDFRGGKVYKVDSNGQVIEIASGIERAQDLEFGSSNILYVTQSGLDNVVRIDVKNKEYIETEIGKLKNQQETE